MNREKKERDFVPSYTIQGNVTGFSEGTKFYLYSLETNANVDSALVEDNKFQMKGHIANPPVSFWLKATDGEDYVYTPLLIGNDSLTVSAAKQDFAWNVNTSGSTIDTNYRKLMNLTKDLDIKRDSLIFGYHAKADTVKEKTFEEFMQTVGEIDSLIKRTTIKYIKETKDTYAGMLSLSFHKDDIPKDSVQLIYDQYNDELKQSKYGRVVKLYLESNHIEKGDPFLNFEGINQFGEETNLADLREENKFLLINYTSAYCGYSIRATDELKEIHNQYQKFMKIVNFSADTQKKDWLYSIERDENGWPSLWDGQGRYSESAIRYNFSVTPTFLLISPDGNIVDRWVGYKKGDLKKGLEEHLQSPNR
ncbi:DUF4369 domain-containing protein [Chryseobacterium gotjawalense]|uniref:DUF4369 domain-containing protein n=1 Tax=Chryseobacterium gotjawalense TaxID=3042315 RepID=A0ABY8RAN5_9FLAO|nr:DUF4369 domain-containing protein [Chryseobacterium sp. wdc7]WHF51028.1 DUF4369 domain-containing protein [Chryseobacterium sp. wdc7]